ncbi:Golgi vesicle fusion to target membrane [Desmophyllum pertusum]|uniref:Golgi vesicle fusion to target membrane n=1 Tax=Desmophyllum pertusum TaxID=174260 RepID=A0A9W9YCP4_9CNID|nr:Golgi vesicle fusion to target membrane [Desmophyllum pertusum]
MAEGVPEFKIVVVGESGVGKSCIVSSFSGDEEAGGQEVTTRKIEVQSKEIKLQIVDTAGTENLRKYAKSLYKGAQGLMVVYDITDKSSFEAVAKWLEDIDEHFQVRYPAIAVIGNKCDIEDRRVITKETLEAFAIDHGISFMEVSGKTGVNIKESFNLLTEEILLEDEELKGSTGPKNYCTLL